MVASRGLARGARGRRLGGLGCLVAVLVALAWGTAPASATTVDRFHGTQSYDDVRWDETLRLVDETSPYALTGAVFADDRRAVRQAAAALRGAAGNFYVNDKPTGAVVGQQPFGGARASGTNDKAGSKLNLVRWVSARAVKETFNPPRDFRYPFMAEE